MLQGPARLCTALPLMRLRFVSHAALLASITWCSVARTAHAQELPPSRAQEVELFDYTVVEGDTCASISQQFFGNRRRYDLIHAYNPDMGPPPHDLEAGQILHLPRRATPADQLADATVTGVERRVEARPRPADDAWVAAQRGLGLYRGGRVATQQRSAAELTFRDTSVVQLREQTLVIIFGPNATTTRTAGMEATLETGALRTRLGELRGGAESGGNTLRVVTGSGTATLAGGSAVVGVDAQGTSRLSNHSSGASLQASSGGRAVALPENTGSLVRTGERPTPPRPLPPAPTWEPGTRRFLGVAGMGGDLEGSWTHVVGASRYRIEIARQPDGREVVFATEVDANITGFQAHRLPAGTFYVTVATLDGDLFESRPSTAERFEIVEGRIVRPGDDGSAAAPAYDPGDPTVEPAARIEVLEGTLFHVPEGFTCQSSSPILLRYDDLRSCNDTTGASVSYPPFDVRRVQTTIDGTPYDPGDPTQEIEGPAIEIARGATREVVLEPQLEGALPDDLTLVADEGVTLTNVRREGNRFTASITVARASESMVRLHWARSSAPTQWMGPVRVLATDAAPVAAVVAPPPAPEPPRQPRLTEAYARSPVVSALVLTDLDRRGSTVGLSLAEIAPAPRAEGLTERTRIAVAADLSLLDDQIQLGTLVPIDVAGRARGTWEAGSLDIYAHARWVPLRRDPAADDSLALAIDLGAWFPTHPEGLTDDDRTGLPLVRLAPSIELAYAFDRVASFRMRQGALLDLDDTGARLWASAYGLDLEVARALSVGVEIDLVLGPEIEANLFAVGISPQLAVELDPLMLGLGMRFGLNRDGQALFGAASVALSASYAFR